MKSIDEFFSRDEVMLVLTTAPTGLGHIRVMAALRDGLGESVPVEIVGVTDPKFQMLHRVASRNVFLRNVMEFLQNNPVAEGLFTRLYLRWLRSDTDEVYEHMRELFKRRRPKPKAMLLLATHSNLGHQLAVVKKRLAKALKTCIVVAVVVTDDSPQKVWGVTGADYLFVPSDLTKQKLLEYMRTVAKEEDVPEVIVAPYPVSGKFCAFLSEEEFADKKRQVAAEGRTKTELLLPISGAAVQLDYFKDMLAVLGRDGRFATTVIARDSAFTKDFLRWCGDQESVETVADTFDREVVNKYEQQYLQRVVALEVTKPSEQTFKVLSTPKQRGGPVMLFTQTIGRQEEDNVRFMRRHGLIANGDDQEVLEGLVRGKVKTIDGELLKRAAHWRGILLPWYDGGLAGGAMVKWRDCGLFSAMMDFAGFMDHAELSCNGVEMLWERLVVEVKKKCGV